MLNVCGLASKTDTPDFIQLINSNDVFIATETKLDDHDLPNVQIPNYKLFVKNRTIYKHKSGGVAIYVKNTLSKYIKMLDNHDSDNSIWLLCNKDLIGFEFLLCAIYIPPESSIYSNIDLFDRLEDEVISFSSPINADNIPILLAGDFNSWCGEISDFIENCTDDPVFNFDIDVSINSASINSLDTLGIQTLRSSKHKRVNNYGNRLIQLCKNNNIFIANGRLCNDNVAHFTFKDTSVVDYCIMSPEIMANTHKFEVGPFDPLFSDNHNPIHFTIVNKNYSNNIKNPHDNRHSNDVNTLVDDTNANIIITNSKIQKPNLGTDHKRKLCNKIDLNSIKTLNDEIDNLNLNKTVTVMDINKLTTSLNEILTKSADKAGFYPKKNSRSTVKRSSNINYKKSWYNDKCYKLRNKYRNAKNNYAKNKTLSNKNKMIHNSKKYKKTLKNCRLNYYQNINEKLRTLKTSNSKEFWKVLKNNKKPDIKAHFKDLFQHFKQLNTNPVQDNNYPEVIDDVNVNNVTIENSMINTAFDVDEVTKGISKLRCNKACGIDGIVNEFIKDAADLIAPSITKIFNLILDSGIVPDDWCLGIITAIFKNKGSPEDPSNYRGISILSCFSKLFTSLINERLTKYLDCMGNLCENQTGFRNDYSTLDHIFSLKCIIDIFLNNKKRLYCAFVDYSKAFDMVNRNKLWHKLLSNGINGKILAVIQNLYNKAKSCLKHNSTGNLSKHFQSMNGVRQGDNLSPLLFSIYLNDLENELAKKCKGLSTITKMVEEIEFDDIVIYLKLYCLLYADDTILLAESVDDLQKELDTLNSYCNNWDLKVNSDKTKIVIFSRGKIRNLPSFNFNNDSIDVVFEYKYLGIVFNYNGSFVKAKKHLVDQATRAMFALITKARQLCLPIDIQLHLFDSLVMPILLYGCEIWGNDNNSIIERLHLKFCKMLLGINKSSPTCIVLGELGRFPLDVYIRSRMINFWSRLVTDDITKTACIMYKLIHSLDVNHTFHSSYINSIKNTLNHCGLNYIWLNQNVHNQTWLKNHILQNLKDQFTQTWLSDIWNSNSCINYRIFKTSFNIEPYLIKLPRKDSINLCRFRSGCNKLPIITGKFQSIDRENRICPFCNSDVGDEFHYIFICKYFNSLRLKFLPQYFLKGANSLKMEQLFNSSNHKTLKNLAFFTKEIMHTFSKPIAL